MTEHQEGGCRCGAVRYRMEGPAIVVNCCHCTDCQRETGSAFALNAVMEAGRVTLLGKAPIGTPLPTQSGKAQTVWSCPHCHVAVWTHYAPSDDRLQFIRVGTLDDQGAFPPDAHIYVRSKRPWVVLPAGAAASDGFYNPREVWSADAMARWRAAMAD